MISQALDIGKGFITVLTVVRVDIMNLLKVAKLDVLILIFFSADIAL